MEIVISIIAGLVVLGGGIAGIMAAIRHSGELRRCQEAAERIAQEEYLNYSIHGGPDWWAVPPDRSKIMVYIRQKGVRGQGYVFDTARGVRIGRERQQNDICLQDIKVSGNHCRIIQYQSRAAVQDLGSSNGTVVRRGLRRIILYGCAEYLQSHDTLVIGEARLKVTVFHYDPVSM